MDAILFPSGGGVLAAVLVAVVAVVATPVLIFGTQIIYSIYRITIGEWFSPWKHIPKVKTTDSL